MAESSYSADVVPRRSKRIKVNIRNQDSNNDESIISNSASKLFMSIANDDILSEILVRLTHAKYAIRCSLVSKRWFSLIHHPQFTADFWRRRRNKTKNFELLFRIGGGCWQTPPTVHRLYTENQSETNRFFQNLGSGLQWPELKLLTSSLDLLVFKNLMSSKIYVCNPLTHQWLILPEPIVPEPSIPKPTYSDSDSDSDSVSFERRLVHFATGIVCDYENFGQYKVVIISQPQLGPLPDGSFEYDVQVFCSRTRVWSHSKFFLHFPLISESYYEVVDAVSSQGVVYFPLRDGGDEFVGLFVCSPLQSTRLRFVKMPVEGFRRGWGATRKRLLFGVASGRLRVSQLLRQRKQVFRLKIWELSFESDASESEYSWVLVHDVCLALGNSNKTELFVVAFHPYDGDAVFVLRDAINICKYHNIGEEDKYQIVSKLSISDLKIANDYMTRYMRVYSLLHSSCPTPLPKLS